MPLFSSLVLFAAVALQSPSAQACIGRPHRHDALRTRVEPHRSTVLDALPGSVDLYSLRARRRLASLLRLRLLELRKADLERVSRSLEERLEGPGGPAPPTMGR
jgi:hypothetical protein